uniref:Uncharacterized protein n=1 Tax=Arundo donax TaxID=35708 RepID=A0A0A9EHQ6_ARUDO
MSSEQFADAITRRDVCGNGTSGAAGGGGSSGGGACLSGKRPLEAAEVRRGVLGLRSQRCCGCAVSTSRRAISASWCLSASPLSRRAPPAEAATSGGSHGT